MPNDGPHQVASPEEQLKEHVRNAVVHASVYHPAEFNAAAGIITVLVMFGLSQKHGDSARLIAAGELLQALPDCRETCSSRDDKGPGWTP